MFKIFKAIFCRLKYKKVKNSFFQNVLKAEAETSI